MTNAHGTPDTVGDNDLTADAHGTPDTVGDNDLTADDGTYMGATEPENPQIDEEYWSDRVERAEAKLVELERRLLVLENPANPAEAIETWQRTDG